MVLDGSLEEPAWREARATSDFLQPEPREGSPATEKTEFRVLYTPTTLYVGVMCGLLMGVQPFSQITVGPHQMRGLLEPAMGLGLTPVPALAAACPPPVLTSVRRSARFDPRAAGHV